MGVGKLGNLITLGDRLSGKFGRARNGADKVSLVSRSLDSARLVVPSISVRIQFQ